MSEHVQLGKLIHEEAERDAIHVAITPVVAAEDMYPGCLLKFVYGSTELVRMADYDGAIGVADPFLKFRPHPGHYTYDPEGENETPCRIRKGDRFYMLLQPGTATGLRHHYFHPALDSVQQPANEHEKWLREFADRWQFDYDQLIYAGTAKSKSDDDYDRYVVARGVSLHHRDELCPGEYEAFWEHLEALTGQQFDEQHREGMGWSCSC
jgi:hypothetical protein